VTRLQTPTRSFLLLLAATAAAAQTPIQTPPQTASPVTTPHKKPRTKTFQPSFDPNVIVLDPAHGGQDNGANLGKAGLEKDLNIDFADRLRDLLTAKGFTVILTHNANSDDTTADQRVELANRSHAVACLLLHASNGGHGIHLFTSSLTPNSRADNLSGDFYIAPWGSAQAASLPKSLQLANELSTALNGLKVPLLVGRASVSPIDSMFCPAVALEIAPATAESSVADDTYQQHIAESVANALTYWRQHAQDQIAAAQAAAEKATPTTTPTTPAAKPKPKPKPVLINPPDEVPLAPDSTIPKPMPPQGAR